jgi:succinate-acetate transporter protein
MTTNSASGPVVTGTNAVTLGLTGFAINFLIQTLTFTGLFPAELTPLFIGTGYSLGLGMMWVGTHQFNIGDGFAGLVFTAFGAYWVGTATLFLLQNLGVIDFGAANNKAMGIYFVAWTLLTAFLWIGSAWTDLATFIVFAGLLVTLILFVMWGFDVVSVKVGAWVGAADALGAFAMAAMMFINDAAGRTVFPLGPSFASLISRSGMSADDGAHRNVRVPAGAVAGLAEYGHEYGQEKAVR